MKKNIALLITLAVITALAIFLLVLKINHLVSYGVHESYMNYGMVVFYTVVYSAIIVGNIVWAILTFIKNKTIKQ